MPRSIVATVEERLLVPTYTAHWGTAPLLAHRSLALPFQLTGRMRRRTFDFASRQIQVAEIGPDKRLVPFCTRLFGELPPPVHESRRVVWSPADLAFRGNADLILAEVHRWMAPRFRAAGWLIVPHVVGWQGELAQIPPKDMSHGLVDNLRKIRNQGFGIQQVNSTAEWDEFYRTMVVPQAVARYGARAWIPSRRLVTEFSRVGILHFITLFGEPVAGICTVARGKTLWLALSGIREGDPALLRRGAGFAILALTIEWARARGFTHIDAGRTGPFVKDGLQQFKRRWGLQPVSDPLSHVAAAWINSSIIRQAFAREPVLVDDGQHLRAYAGE